MTSLLLLAGRIVPVVFAEILHVITQKKCLDIFGSSFRLGLYYVKALIGFLGILFFGSVLFWFQCICEMSLTTFMHRNDYVITVILTHR